MNEVRGLQMLAVSEPQPETVRCQWSDTVAPGEGTCGTWATECGGPLTDG